MCGEKGATLEKSKRKVAPCSLSSTVKSGSPASSSIGKVRNCVAMEAVLFTTDLRRAFLSRITRAMSRLKGRRSSRRFR